MHSRVQLNSWVLQVLEYFDQWSMSSKVCHQGTHLQWIVQANTRLTSPGNKVNAQPTHWTQFQREKTMYEGPHNSYLMAGSERLYPHLGLVLMSYLYWRVTCAQQGFWKHSCLHVLSLSSFQGLTVGHNLAKHLISCMSVTKKLPLTFTVASQYYFFQKLKAYYWNWNCRTADLAVTNVSMKLAVCSKLQYHIETGFIYSKQLLAFISERYWRWGHVHVASISSNRRRMLVIARTHKSLQQNPPKFCYQSL